jgi:DNA-binding GntR family transcriptional regulator
MPDAPAPKTTAPAATLSDKVFQNLRDRILKGALKPGQRLVHRKLALELSVSTIPVIEALRRLEQDGLVIGRANAGVRVVDWDDHKVLSEETLREAIECQVARCAAGRLTGKTLSTLLTKARAVDKMLQKGMGSRPECIEEHMEFHLMLADASGFALLRQQLERAWFRHIITVHSQMTHAKMTPSNWHSQLIQQIAAGDEEQADKAMRLHVRYNRLEPDGSLRGFPPKSV